MINFIKELQNKLKKENKLKDLFINSEINKLRYNDILIKINETKLHLEDRLFIEDDYYIYRGDKIEIKANIKHYKKFAIEYYKKYPLQFIFRLEHNLSIKTDFRSELTFKEIENIENITILPNAEEKHKNNIITKSKNKNNAIDCIFLQGIEFGVRIDNKQIAFLGEDSDINKFIANTKYIYVSYLDFQAIHYFYKIMNDFI